MSNFVHLPAALLERLLISGVSDVHQHRSNELHLRITDAAVQPLAELLRADFGAELALMAANDRRADRGAYEVVYLFANAAENWFVHAVLDVASQTPNLPSLATFYLPAAGFEREIRDLFGIEPVGHPDPRPLVKHAFWPADYYPLRKDAPRPHRSSMMAHRSPFWPLAAKGCTKSPSARCMPASSNRGIFASAWSARR